MAFSCEVPDVVSASFRASSHNRGVRARRVCLLRLGRLMVPTEEERFPIRVSIFIRGLNPPLFGVFCLTLDTPGCIPGVVFYPVFITSHPRYFLLVPTHSRARQLSIIHFHSLSCYSTRHTCSCFEASVSNNLQGHCDSNIIHLNRTSKTLKRHILSAFHGKSLCLGAVLRRRA